MDREILDVPRRLMDWGRLFAGAVAFALLALLVSGCPGTTLYGVLRDDMNQGRSFASDTVQISAVDGQWTAIILPESNGNWKYKKGKEIRIMGDSRSVNLKKDSLKVVAKHITTKECRYNDVRPDTVVQCVSTARYFGRHDLFKKKQPKVMKFDADASCNCPPAKVQDRDDNKDIKNQ